MLSGVEMLGGRSDGGTGRLVGHVCQLDQGDEQKDGESGREWVQLTFSR